MKPVDWPRYMVSKALSSGACAYYWRPRQKDVKAGCVVHAECLGPDYGAARDRANFLNKQLDAWRQGLNSESLDVEQRGFGTVAWLFDIYLRSSAYQMRVSKRSANEYRRALRRIEEISTKNGDCVGNLPIKSISPAAVDKIYKKLRIGPRGERKRQANLSIDIAARAWDVARRLAPKTVPIDNPWRGVVRDLSKRIKPAATREEAYALAFALRNIGEPHLGAAALICFELHQRPEHVRNGDITWADWRPDHRPDAAFLRHRKTGAKGWVPLDDEGDSQFPELEEYLSALPRLGLPIVLTSGKRGPARPYSAEHAQRRVREARQKAGLGDHVTLDACRHGGLTELGDAGATESEIMSLSMHRTPEAARGYVKQTEAQRRAGTRKRRNLVNRNKTARESE